VFPLGRQIYRKRPLGVTARLGVALFLPKE